jgi:hypothetical protein
MPSNPNFSRSSAATPRGPYAGVLLQNVHLDDHPDGASYMQRAAVPAVYNATQAGGVGFNGSNDLGVSVNGAILQVDNAANLAAWIAAMQVKITAAFPGVAITNPAGLTVRITGKADGTQLTLAPVQPSSPDLTLGAFSLTADTGIAATTILPGMGVVWSDFRFEVAAPLATSTLPFFAGVAMRESLDSPDVEIGLVGSLAFPRRFNDGGDMIFSRKGRMTLCVASGVAVAAGDPVYMGRINGEAGYWFNADDGGNTRLLIPNAAFTQAGTGDPTAEGGIEAILN